MRSAESCVARERALMGAIFVVVRRRLAVRWRALVAAGLLLGIGFGVSLASFAAARRTASAYDRILVASDAPDAAVNHGGPPQESAQSLASIAGVTRQRVYAGFLGRADGVEPLFVTALLAPTSDGFPLERPTVQGGRLPAPDRADEVFVSAGAAAGAGLKVGQRLHFTFFRPDSPAAADETVTIVGTGTFPMELARDQLDVLGLVVLTHAFYEKHRDLTVYSVSNVYLAPGVDARTDLAPAAAKLGHELQSSRSQERQSANVAVRPLVIALVALALLALAATAVAVAQVIQRDRDRWRSDSANLLRVGMVRSQLRLIQLTTAGVIAALTIATAMVVFVLASPVAPIGPLHDFDPAQGYAIDGVVAGLGIVAIVVAIALCAVVFSALPARAVRPVPRRALRLPAVALGPATIAGLTLALRADNGRVRTWRAVGATTLAATLLGISVAGVASAVTLIDTPARYGFDADLLALNQYGDQSLPALGEAFADDATVAAATGFTSGTFLVDGLAVPGIAATAVKRELSPTILRGQPVRTDREIVVGQDTLESLGAHVGDVVPVQIAFTAGSGDGSGNGTVKEMRLRIVGVAIFPSVHQAGTDMVRLGIGALVTRGAYLAMGGDAANDPEFTTVKLVGGADPAAVIARNAEGFSDVARTKTSWFTDAKPAELRQLDAAMPYLRGGLAVGYLILFAVVAHALWTRVRGNRRELAVLRALGSTRSQLDAVTAWQAAPFALAAIVIGLPLGIALGRWAFGLFARSLAVVDRATISAATLGTLVGATLLALTVAAFISVVVGRRTLAAVLLRGDE
jgi:hypothetical protein